MGKQCTNIYHEKRRAIERKSLRFGRILTNGIHYIPTRHELTTAQRSAMWYTNEEIHGFKRNALYIGRILKIQEQGTASQHSTEEFKRNNRPLSNDSTLPRIPLAVCVKDCEVQGFRTPPRGLECYFSYERRLRKQLAINAILCRQETHPDDVLGLCLVARRFTRRARLEAYKTGKNDAWIATKMAYPIFSDCDSLSSPTRETRRCQGTEEEEINCDSLKRKRL